MNDSLNLELKSDQESVALDDIEAAVGDYTDDFSDDTESARELINGTRPSDGGEVRFDLHKIGPDALRVLRRALKSLTSAGDPGVLDDVKRLFSYAPALTPTLLSYVSSVSTAVKPQVADVLDDLIQSTTMNEWQRQWVVQTLHELGLLEDDSSGHLAERREWVKDLRLRSPSMVTIAYSTLALAAASVLTFDEAMQAFEEAPSSLLSWHAAALRISAGADARNQKRLTAASRLSPIHAALMAS
jgi:hypothetical protein